MTSINRENWPTCQTCMKLVGYAAALRDNVSGEFIIKIWCHGATEEFHIGDAALVRMDKDTYRDFMDNPLKHLGPCFPPPTQRVMRALPAPENTE